MPAYFGGLGVYEWRGILNIEGCENGRCDSNGARWLWGPIDATTGRWKWGHGWTVLLKPNPG